MRRKLTDKFIASVQAPKRGRIEIADALEPGLTLRITENDARTWVVRVWTGPKDKRVQRRITLGHPRAIDGGPVLTLAQARQAARDIKQAAAEGRPLVPGDGVKGAMTFAELVEQYLAWAKDTKRPRTVEQTGRMLRHHDLAALRDRPAAGVTADDVRAVRDAITERGAPVQATRTLRALGALGRWGVSEGKIPSAFAKDVLPRTVEKPRDRVLTDPEIAAFVKACDALEFPFGWLFMMLLLTGQRLRECAEMELVELDLDHRTWVIPGGPDGRTKNGRPNTVHLSEPVMAILEKLAERRSKIEALARSRFVFTTTGEIPVSGFVRAKRRLDQLMAESLGRTLPNFTLHDLRRSCATLLARLKTPPHICERILNHKDGVISGVAAIYNQHDYSDEVASALEKLGRHVTALAEPRIVPFKRA